MSGVFTTDNFRALVGFRIEQTKFVNESANTVAGVITPVLRRFKYSEFLPNVQLSYEPAPGLKLRAAFTEAIGRPDFADFANGYTVTFNAAGVEVVSGTNPYLPPRKSKNYDASIEYYIRGGYIALGLFQKDLVNETFRQVRETRDGAGVLTKIETIPLSAGSAKVQGLELSFVKERLDFLPGFLANFGLNANYTYLEGDWHVVFTDGSRRTVDGLRNQPKWLGNVVLNYNQGRFGANLGYRLRGKTFTGSFGTTPATDGWIDSYARLDAQVNFKLLPKLTLFAEGKNLTNRYWVEQTGLEADALTGSNNPGRVFWFGLTYKM
jgi:TonB-dependent receptor